MLSSSTCEGDDTKSQARMSGGGPAVIMNKDAGKDRPKTYGCHADPASSHRSALGHLPIGVILLLSNNSANEVIWSHQTPGTPISDRLHTASSEEAFVGERRSAHADLVFAERAYWSIP